MGTLLSLFKPYSVLRASIRHKHHQLFNEAQRACKQIPKTFSQHSNPRQFYIFMRETRTKTQTQLPVSWVSSETAFSSCFNTSSIILTILSYAIWPQPPIYSPTQRKSPKEQAGVSASAFVNYSNKRPRTETITHPLEQSNSPRNALLPV